MTEESKQNLLDFFVGNLKEKGNSNEPIFFEGSSVVNDLNDKIQEKIGVENVIIKGWLQVENSENYCLYGFYISEGSRKGIIVILDQNFQVLQIITKFSTGSDLKEFVVLAIDEENNVYGVDSDGSLGQESKYRFIMLNNFFVKTELQTDYQVVLRTSYYFPDNLSDFTFPGIPTEENIRSQASNYVFVGTNSNQTKMMAIHLKVNVGQENEWTSYVAENNILTNYYSTIFYILNDNIVLKMAVQDSINQKIVFLEAQDGALKETKRITVEGVVGIKLITEDSFYVLQLIQDFTNNNETFIIQMFNNNSLNTIYSEDRSITDSIYNYFLIDNCLYVFSKMTNGNLYEYTFGIVYENAFYFQKTESQESTDNVFLKNNYNLYNFILQFKNNVFKLPLLFNRNNYNGQPFSGSESLNANSGILYSNNDVIFARNLYNKTISDNVTNSVLEVPNSFLNGVSITSQDLLSKSNNVMISNQETIEKNIYEDLFINFINAVNIYDRNNNSNIFNRQGSITLNNAINNSLYDSKKMTKFRLNYEDDTTRIEEIYVKSTENEKEYMLICTFYVDKMIKSLDFISNDEQTIYQTVDLTNLTLNKYYSIFQKVSVM